MKKWLMLIIFLSQAAFSMAADEDDDESQAFLEDSLGEPNAWYVKLINKLHVDAKAQVPSEDEAIVLTFGQRHRLTFYLHKNLIPPNVEILKHTGHFDDIHPLTVLFYISLLHTQKIPFELVDKWESFTDERKISIVARISDFMNMIGDNDRQRLNQVREFIVIFMNGIYIQLSADRLNSLMKKEIISQRTFHFLSRPLAEECRKKEVQRKENIRNVDVEKKAQKIMQKVQNNKESYSAMLMRKTEKDEPVYVHVKGNNLKNPDTREVWEKACHEFNSDVNQHDDTYELAIQNIGYCTCSQCCTCFWCYFCCCPCMCIWSCLHSCPSHCDGGTEELRFKYIQ